MMENVKQLSWLGLTSIFMVVFGSAFEVGWNVGVMNLLENFIQCWMVVDREQNQTLECENAFEYSEKNLFSGVIEAYALCVSIFAIGAVVGSPVGGFLADTLGRRKTLALNAIIAMAGTVLLAACRYLGSYYALLIGRFLVGISTGITTAVGPVYINEIVPNHQQGSFGLLYGVFICTGILVSQIFCLGSLLGSYAYWDICLLLGAFPPCVQLLLLIITPETPAWLESHGKPKQASRVSEKLYKKIEVSPAFLQSADTSQPDVMNSTLSLKIINGMRSNSAANIFADGVERRGVRRLLRNSKLVRAVIVAVLYHVIQQLVGVNAVMFYSAKILQRSGFSKDWCAYGACGISLLNVTGAVISSRLVEKTGRNALMKWGCVGSGVCMLFATVLLSQPDLGEVTAYATFGALLVYIIFFASGPGSIPWVASVELVETEYKSGCAALCGIVNFLCTFLVALVFPILEQIIHHYVFLVFVTAAFAAALFVHFMVPEFKDKEPIQFQIELEKLWD